jgi:hypothetical protein
MGPTVQLAVLTEPDPHRADGTRLLGVLSYRDDGDRHHRRLAHLQPTPADDESGPVQLRLPLGVELAATAESCGRGWAAWPLSSIPIGLRTVPADRLAAVVAVTVDGSQAVVAVTVDGSQAVGP